MNQTLVSTVVGLPLLIWAIASPSIVAQQTPPPPASSPQTHAEMPAGPGRDLALRICVKCHTITNITSQHKDTDGWTATITKMVGYGAVATDDELQTILDYLTANYGLQASNAAPAPESAGKVDVNKETAAQLEVHLKLTNDEAKAVVTYRDKNGPFKSIDDLKKVPNLDTKKIDAKKDSLLFP